MILFHLLAGQEPFEKMPIRDVVQAIRSGVRPQLSAEAQLSPIADVITVCWNPDPSLRPTFAQLLDLFASGTLIFPRARLGGLGDIFRAIASADGMIWDPTEYATNVIEGITNRSRSRLFSATRSGDVSEFMEFITLAPEMDVNARDESGTPLIHLAILSGSDVLVGILARLTGVDLNAVDSAGLTPLMAVARVKDGKMTEILLDTGKVEVNRVGKGGDSALHIAAEFGAGRVVKKIIANGGDKWKRNSAGKTPADVARAAGMLAIVQILE
jgi:hypothetical protein